LNYKEAGYPEKQQKKSQKKRSANKISKSGAPVAPLFAPV